MSLLLHALPFGKYAAAVILPVQPVFVGELDGTLVAVFLLEVGGQVLHLIDLGQFLSDLVDFPCIFQRADGKSGGKIIIAALFRQSAASSIRRR